MKKRVLIPGLVVAVLGMGLVFRLIQAGSKSQTMTPEVGAIEGKLRPCASDGNCRSSVGDPAGPAYFPPLSRQIPTPEYVAEMVGFLGSMGGQVRTREANYIHAEFKSSLFGLVDDVEVLVGFDGRVDVRSASRVGKWDLGANEKRLAKLRELAGN